MCIRDRYVKWKEDKEEALGAKALVKRICETKTYYYSLKISKNDYKTLVGSGPLVTTINAVAAINIKMYQKTIK